MNSEKRRRKLLEHRKEVNLYLNHSNFNFYRLKDYGKKNLNNSKQKKQKKWQLTDNYKKRKNIDNKLYKKKKKDY
jgi:hypothetical protein